MSSYHGHLKYFGFIKTPKAGNLVQTSTLVADAELCDYSGTYVATAP